MTETFPVVPTFIERNETRGCWDLFVSCPLCGDTHLHGGGTLDADPLLGHRVSHCLWGVRIGYVLEARPADMAKPVKLTGIQRRQRGSLW